LQLNGLPLDGQQMTPRRKGSSASREKSVYRLAARWSELVPGDTVLDNGLQNLRRLLTEYSYGEVRKGMQTACDRYLVLSTKGKPTNKSASAAWEKIGSMCYVAKHPDERTFLYIRGIFNNHEIDYPEPRLRQEVHNALKAGVTASALIGAAKRSTSWSAFCDHIDDLLAECEG
jgi:hypothetical protein